MTDLDIAEYGRQAVENGDLKALRKKLGLTVNAMAEMLHTSPTTYRTWEDNTVTRMWTNTAERIGRFVLASNRHLGVLAKHNVDITELMPLNLAAGLLGVPQSLLQTRYREGAFEADDLGILGLWVSHDDLPLIRDVL